jgi:SusD family.
MKNIYKIFTFGLLLSLLGCDDYLTQEAQDLVIPKNVSQYKELLQGDGYFKDLQKKMSWTYIFTDDIATGDPKYASDPSKIESLIGKFQQVYQWQSEIENDVFQDELYSYLYSQALPGTICLERISSMEGSDEEKKILRGQASFQRALAYFYIANFYGPAYNESKPEDLCVPMSLTATATPGSYPRQTIEFVWGHIKDDAETAVECLKGYSPGVYEINYEAALLLASRVALFMEDYDLAIKHALELLEIAPKLFDMVNIIDLEKYHNTSDHGDEKYKPCILNTNLNPDEIVWTFSSATAPSLFYQICGSLMTNITFCPSDDLIKLYDRATDDRLAFYYIDPDPESFWISYGYQAPAYLYQPNKYYQSSSCTGFKMAFRNVEVYLTLAESYARKATPDKEKAINYLNEILKTRIVGFTPLTEGDFGSNEALVERIWKERRLELSFEEAHRWWDMRRCGQKGFTRRWMTGENFVISDHDLSFTLNFPKTERDFDSGLVWNTRPIRTAE